MLDYLNLTLSKRWLLIVMNFLDWKLLPKKEQDNNNKYQSPGTVIRVVEGIQDNATATNSVDGDNTQYVIANDPDTIVNMYQYI